MISKKYLKRVRVSDMRFLPTVITSVTLIIIALATRDQVFAAPSESVLWSFGGAYDGAFPGAGLIEVNGKLYGTTYQGGPYGGFGTVFELTPPAPGQTQWSEGMPWSFGSAGDGLAPQAGLIKANNKLYGTTVGGGAYGWGTVFDLTPPASGQTRWSESLLWSFGGARDGILPEAGLIGVNGKLYGTSSQGGPNGGGIVFGLAPPAPGQTQWSESRPWRLGSGAGDGIAPQGGLLEMNGKLYGTTEYGANGTGTVFELAPPASGQTQWSKSVLWNFGGTGDGSNPLAGLIEVNGKLYGTTEAGGANGDCNFNVTGCGTVFELTPPAPGQTQWSERVPWNFGAAGDGIAPRAGLLEMDGKLYGTTAYGGAYGGCNPYVTGCGTVFELTPPAPGQTQWSESVWWNFGGPGDGSVPVAGLIKLNGKLYGTTDAGGAIGGCSPFVTGCGTVFEVTP